MRGQSRRHLPILINPWWSGAARIFFPAGIRMEEMSIVVSIEVRKKNVYDKDELIAVMSAG